MDEKKSFSLAKWIIGILLVVNIFSIAIIWILVSGEKMPHPGIKQNPPPEVEQMLQKELDLTDQQVQQFKKLRLENAELMRATEKEVMELKKQLADKLSGNRIDSVQIKNLANKIGILQAEMERFLFKHFEKLIASCNEKQKEKFIPMLQRVIIGGPAENMPAHNPGPNDKEKMGGPPPFNRGDRPPPMPPPEKR